MHTSTSDEQVWGTLFVHATRPNVHVCLFYSLAVPPGNYAACNYSYRCSHKSGESAPYKNETSFHSGICWYTTSDVAFSFLLRTLRFF